MADTPTGELAPTIPMIRVRARAARGLLTETPARVLVAGSPGCVIGFSARTETSRVVRPGVPPALHPYLTITWDAAATSADLTDPDAMEVLAWTESDVDPEDVEWLGVLAVPIPPEETDPGPLTADEKNGARP